jgi:hypothetical protein
MLHTSPLENQSIKVIKKYTHVLFNRKLTLKEYMAMTCAATELSFNYKLLDELIPIIAKLMFVKRGSFEILRPLYRWKNLFLYKCNDVILDKRRRLVEIIIKPLFPKEIVSYIALLSIE